MIQRTPVRKRRPGPARKGPWRSEKYRRYISQHLCCLCCEPEPGCVHDVGTSQTSHTCGNGMSSKGSDASCVPLCREHHDRLDGRTGPRLTMAERKVITLAPMAYFAQWKAGQAS